jgi:hypothetical protein
MAPAAALLYTLLAPSTNEVGEVYLQLKNILGTAIVQQRRVPYNIELRPPCCPQSFQGWGATERLGSSRCWDSFLTGVDFSPQSVVSSRRPVETPWASSS